jgi:CheY-like chemotaxis protein
MRRAERIAKPAERWRPRVPHVRPVFRCPTPPWKSSGRYSHTENDHGRHGGRILTPPELVLIAEPDRNVRELQRVFLERAGLGVEFADDGLAALELARVAPPALVVTEILLPRLDGLTLCRRLRDEPATAHVPVVVFSILAAAARAAEAGARTFLRKPLVESTFVAAVLDAIPTQSPAKTEQQWASR